MLSRRRVLLASSSALGLIGAGCDIFEKEHARPPGLPAFSIDIHAHIFNATDIPIPGFLNQVFLRSPESPVKGNYPVSALVRLITDILLLTVRTADEELGLLLQSGTFRVSDAEELQQQDKRAVAQGIRAFEQRNQRLRSRDASEETREDDALLRELNQLASRGLFASRSSQDLGTAVADAIYDAPQTGTTSFRVAGGDFDLAQNLKWAALLTRDRKDILGELVRLYGLRGPGGGAEPAGILAFSPSLLDFEYWFRDPPQSRFSSIPDQIAVMSRLAKLEQRAIVLNFAPFCPLRAAVEGGHWHNVVRDAILNKGFVGVKIYPPMGFRPLNNPADKLFGQRARVNGAAIDRELRRMYRWCERHGVPIKAHGNNSLAAGVCTGLNAAPNFWAPVLAEFRNLRINIAHFGGFEEEAQSGECADSLPSYEERAADLISRYDNAYVDLGYWTEVAGRNRPGSKTLQKVDALLAEHDGLADRIMYGSDYTMIGRERQHGAYLADVKTAIAGLDGAEDAKIFALNARSYLQLDDATSQTRQRLRRFFPPGHAYFAAVKE